MSNSNVPWLPVVKEIADGNSVDAVTVNMVTDQLVQRETFLYNAIQNIQDKSVLVSLGRPINPTETGMSVSGQYVVAYTNDTESGNSGLVRALTSFTNSIATTYFAPSNTSYCFGITQTVYGTSADIYLQGLINFTTAIDDPTNGLLDFTTLGVREIFRPGPYFLSARNPGTITSNPSGVLVYIGYAPNNTTLLLNADTNSFNEFFYNVQTDLLARPTGVPVLSGSTWSIPTSDLSRLGWVDTNYLPGSYTIPINPTTNLPAAFIYNIPSNFHTDNADNGGTGSLSSAEEAEAQFLYGLLPPNPSSFAQYFINGVLQRQLTGVDTDGNYTIDQFGFWSFSSADGKQPWAASLASGWLPANWPTNKGISDEIPLQNLIFSKLNPALNTALVTSLTAYPDGSANVLKLTSKQSSTPSATGDLYIQYLMPFAANTANTSAPTAIQDFTFSQTTGEITKVTIPVVSTLTTPANSGITITNDDNGNFSISQAGQGNTGPLDDTNEINANYEYLGLNSYLRLKYNTSVTAGFGGKITLPSNFPTNVNLKIVLQLFGFAAVASTPLSAGYSFQYSVSTAQNGVSSVAVKALNSTGSGTILTTSTFTTSSGSPALVTFPSSYVANTVLTINPVQFVIPAANIGPDSIVNFKVLQSNPSVNPYNSDVALLTAYWSLL